MKATKILLFIISGLCVFYITGAIISNIYMPEWSVELSTVLLYGIPIFVISFVGGIICGLVGDKSNNNKK